MEKSEYKMVVHGILDQSGSVSIIFSVKVGRRYVFEVVFGVNRVSLLRTFTLTTH